MSENKDSFYTLLDSPEGLAAIFLNANEGILVADKTGTIVKINPAGEKMFGYPAGELKGQKIEVIVPTRSAAAHTGHRDKYNENPHARKMGANLDLFAKRKDGTEFPVEISLSPFVSENERFVIAFIIDISIRKKAEDSVIRQKQELIALNAELETRVRERTMILEEAVDELNKTKEELKIALQQEKELNDLKTRFVSMASHEFRTPLATILSSISLVSKYKDLDEKVLQDKHIVRIKTSVLTLTDILNDVLSISKLDEGGIRAKPERFSIRSIATEVLKEMEGLTKKGQKIVYTHHGETEVFLDRNFMKHILINLTSNAIKFSPENKNIEWSSEIKSDALILKIKDQGLGISEEDQKHLFQRFFRAQNVTNIQGTGLGLNIVAKYLELLQGRITFESKLGEGSTFTMNIPKSLNHE